MPRPTNFVAFIRKVGRDQVQEAVQGLLGVTARPRKKAANRRRRRRRRHRGPGRPPGAAAAARCPWGRNAYSAVATHSSNRLRMRFVRRPAAMHTVSHSSSAARLTIFTTG